MPADVSRAQTFHPGQRGAVELQRAVFRGQRHFALRGFPDDPVFRAFEVKRRVPDRIPEAYSVVGGRAHVDDVKELAVMRNLHFIVFAVHAQRRPDRIGAVVDGGETAALAVVRRHGLAVADPVAVGMGRIGTDRLFDRIAGRKRIPPVGGRRQHDDPGRPRLDGIFLVMMLVRLGNAPADVRRHRPRRNDIRELPAVVLFIDQRRHGTVVNQMADPLHPQAVFAVHFFVTADVPPAPDFAAFQGAFPETARRVARVFLGRVNGEIAPHNLRRPGGADPADITFGIDAAILKETGFNDEFPLRQPFGRVQVDDRAGGAERIGIPGVGVKIQFIGLFVVFFHLALKGVEKMPDIGGKRIAVLVPAGGHHVAHVQISHAHAEIIPLPVGVFVDRHGPGIFLVGMRDFLNIEAAGAAFVDQTQHLRPGQARVVLSHDDVIFPGGVVKAQFLNLRLNAGAETFFAIRNRLLPHLHKQFQSGIKPFDGRHVDFHGFRIVGFLVSLDRLEIRPGPPEHPVADPHGRVQAVHIHRLLIDETVQQESGITAGAFRDAHAERRQGKRYFALPGIDDCDAGRAEPFLHKARGTVIRRDILAQQDNAAGFQFRDGFLHSAPGLVPAFHRAERAQRVDPGRQFRAISGKPGARYQEHA